MTPVERLLAKLPDAKKTARGWSAKCPAHDDRRASLSIAEGDDGRALVHCHAGCTVDAICAALGAGLMDLMPTANMLPTPNKPNVNGKRRIVATYDYRDEAGELLFQVVRYDPKDFRQRRPKPGGGWNWSVKGVRVIPYRLPALLAEPARPVFVVEGEKDADNLARIGVLATCNAGGAGKWTAQHAEFLRGRCVIVLADNDEPGRNHAEQVTRSSHGIAKWVRTVELPGLAAKGDVSDWISAGGTKDELQRLAEATPEWKPAATMQLGAVLMCLADVEPREILWLWPGRIPLGRITLLVGRPGEGKSFLTTDAAARVTTGTPWPDGSQCPRGAVILISAEDNPADTIRPRLDAHYADVQRAHLLSAVRRVNVEGKPCEVMFTLADVTALENALKRLPDCKLIVVDPVGSFLGGRVDAHRDNEVRGVLAPVVKLAEKYGPAILVVAHRRKSPGSIADDLALGSRAFTGIARVVWHLTRDPEDKSRRLLLPGKNNLAREGDGLAFTIIGEPPRISWQREPVAMCADDALAVENQKESKPGPQAKARSQAAEWLGNLLRDGPMEVAKIKEETEAAGFAWRTVHRAKDELGIKPYRREFSGPWLWLLPNDSTSQATCQLPQKTNNLASWHDSKKHEENLGFERGTIGTCQDDLSWHDRYRDGENRVRVTI